jgi:hypothetical protein
MKFAILSLAAAAALTLSAGTASAQWGHSHRHHHHNHHGHGHSHRGGHLDYHNGHYHYHNGSYRSGPLYPAYPTYGYGSSYGSGVNLQFGQFGLSVGNSYYSPYRSTWGYGAYPW